MPNWCSNIIRIRNSTPERIDEVLSAIINEGGQFDFNRLIQRLEILDHTASGHTTIDGVAYTSWYVETMPDGEKKRPFTDDEIAQLKQIGFSDWYEWSVHHWGTKWNASNTEVDDSSKKYGDIDITYQTAWGPPVPVLEALKSRFPDIDIETRYRGEEDDEYPHAA